MRVYREERKFQPVTITIEPQEELDYLLAVLNVTQESAEAGWKGLVIAGAVPKRKLNTGLQMPIYEAIFELYEEK